MHPRTCRTVHKGTPNIKTPKPDFVSASKSYWCDLAEKEETVHLDETKVFTIILRLTLLLIFLDLHRRHGNTLGSGMRI